MADVDAIVIGAGVVGLAIGALLARAGLDTVISDGEQHSARGRVHVTAGSFMLGSIILKARSKPRYACGGGPYSMATAGRAPFRTGLSAKWS